MKKKSFYHSLVSYFWIILIGALGSGLWDLFLKDLLYNTGNVFVNSMSYMYSGYIDSLYNTPLRIKPQSCHIALAP